MKEARHPSPFHPGRRETFLNRDSPALMTARHLSTHLDQCLDISTNTPERSGDSSRATQPAAGRARTGDGFSVSLDIPCWSLLLL